MSRPWTCSDANVAGPSAVRHRRPARISPRSTSTTASPTLARRRSSNDVTSSGTGPPSVADLRRQVGHRRDLHKPLACLARAGRRAAPPPPPALSLRTARERPPASASPTPTRGDAGQPVEPCARARSRRATRQVVPDGLAEASRAPPGGPLTRSSPSVDAPPREAAGRSRGERRLVALDERPPVDERRALDAHAAR